jgi:exopolysaccharide biosynthesis polyprenyl glycosylphosphotransferase
VTASVAGALERAGHGAAGAVCAAPSASGRLRRRLLALSVLADLLALLLAYAIAFAVFSWSHDQTLRLAPGSFDWGLVAAGVVTLLVFRRLGLYRLEAYVSRPLHLMLLLKGVTVALVVTAFLVYAIHSPMVRDSRLMVFATFFVLLALAVVARLFVLDRLYRRDVRERQGATVVVGWFTDAGILVSRLKELRGFAQVRSLQPADRRRNGYDADPRLVGILRTAEPAPRQVILDSASLGHKATLDLVRVVRARGGEVYITGRLVSPLDTGGLLGRLFELPAMRVTRDPGREPSRARRLAARALDVVCSGLALLLLAPVFAVLAVAVKLDSRGPVFYRQERVGLHGRRFMFLKFRSMTAGNDPAGHKEALAAFIQGERTDEIDQADEYGRPVFKMTADARVTRVGRVLRRCSLDELPQFWNVLRGDMSMVGPRPALPYEVEAYKPWHHLRLDVVPGVSGLWQVAGRCRVEFDDMVFQDVVYGMNRSLTTDIDICLRTVPAVLTGTGAA